jgi:DNA repair exonuclease SbcCD ATPase subunit
MTSPSKTRDENDPVSPSPNKDNPAEYIRELEEQCEEQRKALKKLKSYNTQLREKIAALEEKNSGYQNLKLDKSQCGTVRRYARDCLFPDLKVVNDDIVQKNKLIINNAFKKLGLNSGPEQRDFFSVFRGKSKTPLSRKGLQLKYAWKRH